MPDPLNKQGRKARPRTPKKRIIWEIIERKEQILAVEAFLLLFSGLNCWISLSLSSIWLLLVSDEGEGSSIEEAGSYWTLVDLLV